MAVHRIRNAYPYSKRDTPVTLRELHELAKCPSEWPDATYEQLRTTARWLRRNGFLVLARGPGSKGGYTIGEAEAEK